MKQSLLHQGALLIEANVVRFGFRAAADLAVLLLVIVTAAAIANAQACMPPLYQGDVNSCQGINVKFLNRNAITDIDHFSFRWNTDGVTQLLEGNALGASRTGLPCNWSSSITITQILKNGASCLTNSTGSAPHTFPCSLCSNSNAPLSIVSAGNYRSSATSDGDAAAFGESITTVTAAASGRPLPFNLGGVQVYVNNVPACIFFVSPLQVNFHVPAGLSVGLANVRITNAEGKVSTGQLYLAQQAPAVFTQDQTGTGAAAADYGNGYVAIWPTGVNPVGLALSDVWIQTPAGKYFAQYIEKPDANHPNAYIGCVQINFVNLPINGQGAELHVAGFVSQGFTLQR